MLRIAVTGLAATFPFGGVFWDYFQYVLGLRRLGHDVLYIEDTGKWCYDPIGQTFRESGEINAAYLEREIARLDPELVQRWFYRDGIGRTYGRAWKEVVDFCRSADLFLHISGSCLMRDEYFAASRVVLIDSDPFYTQASIRDAFADSSDPERQFRAETTRRHDAFFTFGENIDHPDCWIPKTGFLWLPTCQPIVVDCFASAIVPPSSRRRVLTTVASWEPAGKAPVIDGVAYGGKSAEFERFMELPSISPMPLEVALSGPAPVERLRAAGWGIVEGHSVSADPWKYRDYLANSFAEFSVAKSAYVRSLSGWLSGRSACYLALGVPVVVQDTGFRPWIDCGEGILPFSTIEEACEAVEKLLADPERHARAAREVCREHFASDKVLTRLIDRALTAPPGQGSAPAG
jgi:glycosyl transferase family 1